MILGAFSEWLSPRGMWGVEKNVRNGDVQNRSGGPRAISLTTKVERVKHIVEILRSGRGAPVAAAF